MFKVLFLQRYYGFGDHQMERRTVDWTSFRYFLSIECVDDVPERYMIPKVLNACLIKTDEGGDLYLDAGYAGQEEVVRQHEMNPIICEKGYRTRLLTKEQKSDNRKNPGHAALLSMCSNLRDRSCADFWYGQ